ncbi:uncharacterized protein LOC123260333 [Cotesia glomerata]|uniref:protein-tyrosine-phosphatase n=1 Tax=Cotesia glomerata TaxID=32391 RepID=A0AAV7I9D1_COTGL|nr:uncharacterized protein LOC123260333 [Cotesia glomerata]KAH0548815.1 hypothetical protein KQX54_002610 [Cotesia glomerata]
MTHRSNANLTIWTGILLLLSATKSQSETTVSIAPEGTRATTTKDYKSSSPGNSTTILRKTLADQEVDVLAHLPALKNDRERETPFYSKLTTEPSVDPRDTQLSQRKLNYKEKHSALISNNHDTNISSNKTTKLLKIDLLKTDKASSSDNQSKKHFFEQLIAPNGHKIVELNGHELAEFNLEGNESEEADFDESESREATTPKIGVISLANDTQVNFKSRKKEIHEDAVLIKRHKLIKNPVEKLKTFDKFDQIEGLNASAALGSNIGEPERIQEQKLPSELIEPEIGDNKTEKVESNGKSEHFGESEDEESENDNEESLEKSEDLGEEEKDTEGKVNGNGDGLERIVEEKEPSSNEKDLTPKARTISFGGGNRFSSTEEKATGFAKENGDVNLTKDFKPYPYFKTPTVVVNINASENIDVNVNAIEKKKSGVFNKETDEIYTYENTINKSKDEKNYLVTESSVVIDNSIQTKPVNLKRSSNATKLLTDSSILSPSSSSLSSVTVKSIAEPVNNTHVDVSDNDSLNLNLSENLKIKDNVNDIPRNPEEVVERKGTVDLASNGLTGENIEKNSTDRELVTSERPIIEANINQSGVETQLTDEIPRVNITELNETATMSPTTTLTTLTTLTTTTPIMTSTTTTSYEKPVETMNLNSSSIKPLGVQLISTSPAATSSDVDEEEVTTSGVTANKLEITSSPITEETTLSPENMTSPENFSKTLTFNSTVSSIDFPEITTAAVEYEFVGLNESTSAPFDTTSGNADGDRNVSTTLAPKLSSVSSESPDEEITTIETVTGNELLTTTETNNNLTDTTASYITTAKDADETTISSEVEATTVEVTKEINGNETNDLSSTESIPISEVISSSGASSSSIVTTNSVETTADELNTTPSVTPTFNPLNVTSSTESNIDEMTSKIESSTVATSVEDDVTESTVRVVTEDDVQRFTPGDVTLLVRIVVEGTWTDICPHLSALKQSLANLLATGMDKNVSANQIIFQKNPCDEVVGKNMGMELILSTIILYVIDENGNFDAAMTQNLPNLYNQAPFESHLTIRSFQLVQDGDSGNAIAVIVVSCVAFVCLVLLASLLFIMRKRQTRFNYGERCRPVSLDAYSLDSVSAYNSIRRKGARASKRSYGNPTFEDSTVIPSHPLNFAVLSVFCNEQNAIYEEFTSIPQVSARIDELPPGAEVKNRYANVVPLPETRVSLMKSNNDPLSEYINASYVRGPKNATKYYIACQAPIESTVTDFWRMIWEQQSKVIIMLTDLIENGVEKCSEYIPPSEVTDCHRLYGDYQVTLKKRETKEKYAISTIHLKNLENNTYREVFHIWYLWPANGVQTDAAGLIAILLEARALQRGGPGPIVVHCSPGTGRTGTLIALDLGIRQYEITRTVDVPRVVYTIRRDRAGAVQTKEQYAFIYKALNLYATKLAGGGLEST